MPLACAAGYDAPRVFICLLPSQRLAGSVGGGEVLHVTRKLAHHVGAGRPDRHHESLFLRTVRGMLDSDVDFKQMRVRTRHRDSKRDFRRGLRRNNKGQDYQQRGGAYYSASVHSIKHLSRS